MSEDKIQVGKFADLKKRAQVFMSETKESVSAMSPEDIRKLVHELDTYQIELELQNEDLLQAQEKLNESRKRFSDLYDFAPVGYLTISEKGMIAEANLTAAEMFGVERGLLLNQPFSAFIVNEDQDIHYKCRKILLETNEPQTCEFRMRKKDGNQFFAQLKNSISLNVDGSSGQFRVVITDISQQKQLEKNILQSKKEWEMTFDAMGDIVTLMDKDLRIMRANKAAHEFFNVRPGGLNGEYCYELFRGESNPCAGCPMLKSREDSEIHCTENIEHTKLGKIFQVSSSPLFDEKGEFQYLVHYAKDITEIKKLEEQLFQSHKMEAMGTLAGGIAHDFNNILAAIIGYAELAKDAIPESKQAQNDLDQVLMAGNRAKELVKQILTFSRKNHGLKKESLQPQLIIKEVIKMMRASLPSTIEIIEDIEPDCDAIFANPAQLHQIIVNLCTNALNAIKDEQGIITIQLSNTTLGEKEVLKGENLTPGPFVELTVKDTGCGINEGILDRIFEPYFTTMDVGKGSGIGLAVVHGIVISHGGLIKVESEVGKGSAFKIYFPSAPARKLTSQKEESQFLPVGTEKILVVDDEEIIAQYLNTILVRLGYSVTCHTKSLEALEDFRSRPGEFDLVITDQTMPKMPGTQLVKELMKLRPDIRIIMCTGYSTLISEMKAKDIGIKRFIMKPVTIAKLAKNVREVLTEEAS